MARLFPTETAIQGLQAELTKLDEALAAKLISPKVWGKARERLNRELQAMQAKAAEEGATDVGIWSSEEAQREMETWTGTMGEILPTVEAANDNFANSFKDMSERVLGSMRNLVDGIKNGDFLDILGGVLDVFMSLGSTGLFGKGLQTSIGKMDFGGFRANGGPVGAGRSYVVGERGPEWFTPGRSGYITPNGKSGGRPAPVVIQMYSEEGPALVPRVSAVSEGVTMQHMTRSAAYGARAGRQRLAR